MKFSREIILNNLKYIAWSSMSIAGISITLIVVYAYRLHANYEQEKFDKKIEFIIARNPEVMSYSNAKIYINGCDKYIHLESDSKSHVSFSINAEKGFRPVGKIDGIIESLDRNAVSIKIQYKEGENANKKFVISPRFSACDSTCLSRIDLHKELDSLRKNIITLQRKIINEEL